MSKKLDSTYLSKILSSGISAKDAVKLSFAYLTPEQSASLGHQKIPSLKIPYFTPTGERTAFYRIRYLDSTRKGFAKQTSVKDQRYDQPTGVTTEIYIPPVINWSKFFESKQPLFITEGELKAACATLKGYPTIALGGVWNFCSRKKGVALLPIFKDMNLEGRTVYIVFDSDAIANAQVAVAENELCRQLTSLKCSPMIVRLPSLGESKKTGLDDYLVSEEANNFESIVEQSTPFKLAQELLKMNEEVIYIENPSLVMRRKDNYRVSVGVFKNELYIQRAFLDISGEKPKEVRTADKWIKWEGKATANRFVYEPGKPEYIIAKNGVEYNMWKGLPFEPKKGDIKPWNALMEYVFQEDTDARKWFEQWLAYPLQYPGTKLFTATVLWSVATGTGKTLIGHTMQRLYGADNSIMIRKRDLLTGNNSFAENKQFILGEEITGEEKRGMVDELKSLITNEEMRINIKYVPEYSARSCANYYFTSNHPDAFFLDETDRRFFVHEIVGDPLEEKWYTETYDPWYKSEEGASALLYYFLNMDLKGFSPTSRAPMTESKQEMIENSRSALSNWVYQLRSNPDSVLKVGNATLPYSLWSTTDLLKVFDPEAHKRVGAKGLSTELKRARIVKAAGGRPCRVYSGQQRLWAIRDPQKFYDMAQKDVGEYYDKERATEIKVAKFAKKGGA